MKLNGAPFYENGLERLNTQAVKRGGAVEKDGVVLYNLVKYVPYDGLAAVYRPAGALYVLGEVAVYELAEDEGLEQLESHFFGQAALIELELGAYHDNRTAGVVYALAEEILAEPAPLAAEHIRKRLEIAVARARYRFAVPAVVDEGVYRFLKHTLFVADDDVGSARLYHLLKAVVTVYNPSVKVVEVAGREPAAVQLHHRAEFGGQHGKHIQYHPFGTVSRLAERLDNFEPLGGLYLLDAAGGKESFLELLALGVKVDFAK